MNRQTTHTNRQTTHTGTTARIRLAQMEVLPGQPETNTRRILEIVAQAKADGVALVAFPELAVPGCLLGDRWDYPAFVRACDACGEQIRQASTEIIIVFGNVALMRETGDADGQIQHGNALFFAENGRFCRSAVTQQPYVVKPRSSRCHSFDDRQYFCHPDRPNEPMQTSLGLIGGMLGDVEDDACAWAAAQKLAHQGARFLIQASCSPFVLDAGLQRTQALNRVACDSGLPLLYVNAVGVQDRGKTIYVFDGASGVYDGHGHVLSAHKLFEETTLTLDLPLAGQSFGDPVAQLQAAGPAVLAQAVEFGMRGLMRRLGIRRVVVGVSGGIDSALSAALYSRIVAPEDLLLLSLPGPYTSQTTRRLARELAVALGSRFAEVPITPAVDLTKGQLDALALVGPNGKPAGKLTLSAFGVENIQARDRGARILAAAAAAWGGVLSCNANKIETTVGYGTLYGDITGWFSALGDLWKGQVYAVARQLNAMSRGQPLIPEGILTLTPSAELSAAQAVDQGKGDPFNYPYHDKLFRAWVESEPRVSPEDILEWYAEGVLEARIGYDGAVAALFPDAPAFIADLERWWQLYQGLSVAKRIQAPPVLAVSRRPFGASRHEAQLVPWYSERYHALRQRLS